VLKHPLQQAEFLLTAASDEQLPPSGPPEVAFAGRSNSGKSSAINALANQTRLAYTSKMPGRTQQINLFRLRNGSLLADLPGYGYAAVPQQLKHHWQAFLGRYLATRQALVGLALVIDARSGVGPLDHALLASFLPSGRPVLVLATKMDKLTSSAQRVACRSIEGDLASGYPEQRPQFAVVPFSATRRIGIEAAEALLGEWLGFAIEPAAARPEVLAPAKEKAPRARGVPRGRKRLG
jgi:GTP-binding protein